MKAGIISGWSHRINKKMIDRQLNWKNREPTGLISMFSSEYSAIKRKGELIRKALQGVWIARISITSLEGFTGGWDKPGDGTLLKLHNHQV